MGEIQILGVRAVTAARLFVAVCAALLVLSACGGGGDSEQARATGGPDQALLSGEIYVIRDQDGNETEQSWAEGDIVSFSDAQQVVQAADYDGPPVYVDDEFKATLPTCDFPRPGDTWTNNATGETGVHAENDLYLLADDGPCVMRAADAAPLAVPGDGQTSRSGSPATTAAVESDAIATTLLDSLDRLEHSTPRATISLLMPSGYITEVQSNAASNNQRVDYIFSQANKHVILSVEDAAPFLSDDEIIDLEENLSASSKVGAGNQADFLGLFAVLNDVDRTGDGRAVSIAVSDGRAAGYEVDIVRQDRTGSLQYFLVDAVRYAVTMIGVSDEERTAILDSLVVTSVANDRDATRLDADELAARREVREITDSADFVEGPYSERSLDPMTGGWGFVDAPPFGAVEPGDNADLDDEWVACREGDGFACDTLAIDSDFGSAYQRFGLTCGGRSAIQGCSELLGSEMHPDFAFPYDDQVDRFRDRVGGFRLDRIPGPDSPPPGDDPLRDRQWVQCGIEEDVAGCFALSRNRGSAPDIYEAYGMSCGGRRSWESQRCSLLFIDEADRTPAGSPPPGTYDDERADERWIECDEDERRCSSLSLLSASAITDEERQAFRAYFLFADSCGGEWERPFTELTLSGDSCRAPYASMDTIDDVESLPSPPS